MAGSLDPACSTRCGLRNSKKGALTVSYRVFPIELGVNGCEFGSDSATLQITPEILTLIAEIKEVTVA